MKKRDMSWVKLTDEFKYIIGKIENTNKNYFITGKAGTGKSTFSALGQNMGCGPLLPN